jgi:hypothetical protein
LNALFAKTGKFSTLFDKLESDDFLGNLQAIATAIGCNFEQLKTQIRNSQNCIDSGNK